MAKKFSLPTIYLYGGLLTTILSALTFLTWSTSLHFNTSMLTLIMPVTGILILVAYKLTTIKEVKRWAKGTAVMGGLLGIIISFYLQWTVVWSGYSTAPFALSFSISVLLISFIAILVATFVMKLD